MPHAPPQQARPTGLSEPHPYVGKTSRSSNRRSRKVRLGERQCHNRKRSLRKFPRCSPPTRGKLLRQSYDGKRSLQMIEQIKVVDLSELGVRLPKEHVRMVVAQPYLADGVLTPREPYRVVVEAKERLLERLNRTIDVASKERAHFTVVPEYSVPGVNGIAVIEKRVASDAWPTGSILIAGIDGLDRDEYASVIETCDTCVDDVNGKDRVKPDQWVNCCITWVKSKDGKLFRWVQPKLWPAWPEQTTQHQQMFKGRSMFLFRGRRTNEEVFTFGTMICFDWIATTDPTPMQQFLAEAQRSAEGSQIPITWIFIIQHNEKPSHYEFLNRAVTFFREKSYPNATRTDTCLIFANTAGRDAPGSCQKYGTSGLILAPRTPFEVNGGLPTFAYDGRLLRDENEGILFGARCGDVVFRERGECIHAFDQINPSWVQLGAAGRRHAAENGVVHALDGRDHILAPGSAVAAVVKWINDQLDAMDTMFPEHSAALEDDLVSARSEVVAALRRGGSTDLDEVMHLSTPEPSSNPDEWSEAEGAGLSHVVHSLQIAAIGAKLVSVGEDKVHGVIGCKGQCFDVMAVTGESHRACLEHVESNYGRRQRRHLLLVSRDKDNTPWDRREDSILRRKISDIGEERRFTDGRNPSYHVGYQDLIGILRAANSPQEVAEKLYVSS